MAYDSDPFWCLYSNMDLLGISLENIEFYIEFIISMILIEVLAGPWQVPEWVEMGKSLPPLILPNLAVKLEKKKRSSSVRLVVVVVFSNIHDCDCLETGPGFGLRLVSWNMSIVLWYFLDAYCNETWWYVGKPKIKLAPNPCNCRTWIDCDSRKERTDCIDYWDPPQWFNPCDQGWDLVWYSGLK